MPEQLVGETPGKHKVPGLHPEPKSTKAPNRSLMSTELLAAGHSLINYNKIILSLKKKKKEVKTRQFVNFKSGERKTYNQNRI